MRWQMLPNTDADVPTDCYCGLVCLRPLSWAAVIAFPVGWEVGVAVVGNRDDDAADWLRADGADVVRWAGKTPVGLLSGGSGSGGDIQFVGYDHHQIGEEQINVLLDLKKCNRLSLSGCQFADKAGLSKLAKMHSLDALTLRDCGIVDADLPMLLKFKQVNYLSLRGNPITDGEIDILGQMKWLKGLDLNGTELTEKGLAALRDKLPNTYIE